MLARQRQKKLLFLGYDSTQTALIAAIQARDWRVTHRADRVADLSDFDLIVSFGYRHILSADVLKTAQYPVINLHMSYLPFNRGAHPNFWSFYDNTPAGVSIHEMDEGVNTGPIIYQRQVNFAAELTTFAQTYQALRQVIEDLFVEQIDSILTRSYHVIPQQGAGSFHRVKDLPNSVHDWHLNIEETLRHLAQASLAEGKLPMKHFAKNF